MSPTTRPVTSPGTSPGTGPGTSRVTSPGTVEVDRFTRRVMNPIVRMLTGAGLSVKGTRLLTVRGRVSGEARTTVVNLLHHAGHRYLVAPRGETQWVRNLRAAGDGSLRVGRRVESFTAVELTVSDPGTIGGAPDPTAAEQVEVLRAYLEQWAWEVGRFFGDLRHDSPDADLVAALPRFPVFRLSA